MDTDTNGWTAGGLETKWTEDGKGAGDGGDLSDMSCL